MLCAGASSSSLQTMKFAILINAAPFTYQASDTAYHFCLAAVASGHQIERVFFYHDAVHIGSDFASPPQDEVNHRQRWQLLAKQHTIALDICVAAALRRGILDADEATSQGVATNLAPGFRLVGLGQLVHACLTADRLLVFGS
jgi:tRNA 2-thiouridine synthesizing protein D